MSKVQYKVGRPLQQEYDADHRQVQGEMATLRQEVANLRNDFAAYKKSCDCGGKGSAAAATQKGITTGASMQSMAAALKPMIMGMRAPAVPSDSAAPTESANTFYAGPVSGSAAAPSWRAIDVLDLPLAALNAGTVTSVGLSAPSSLLSVTSDPVTASGTLALALVSQAANKVFAGPASPGSAIPAFRTLTSADLPAIAPNYELIARYTTLTAPSGVMPMPTGGYRSGRIELQPDSGIITLQLPDPSTLGDGISFLIVLDYPTIPDPQYSVRVQCVGTGKIARTAYKDIDTDQGNLLLVAAPAQNNYIVNGL